MTERLKLLDLFAGAGGCSHGYQRAGFEVTALDLDANALRRNPAEHKVEARWDHYTPESVGRLFDAIHASPPCQAYSHSRHAHNATHPELIGPVREWLIRTGLPYVIENVPGAPLRSPLMLCGTMFGRTAWDEGTGRYVFLERHRLFESNVPLDAPPRGCAAQLLKRAGYVVGGVYSGGSDSLEHAREVRHGGYTPGREVQEALMGIGWMTRAQLRQAIPPVYAAHVGLSLRAALDRPARRRPRPARYVDVMLPGLEEVGT